MEYISSDNAAFLVFFSATAKVVWDIIWKEKESNSMNGVVIKPQVDKPDKLECRRDPPSRKWKLVGPSGEYMGMVRARKKRWYTEKGLAVELPSRQRVLKLKRGIGINNLARSQLLKQYCFSCSVSGEHTTLFEYHIIPTIYKRELPNHLTETLAHDIAQLCIVCKENMNRIKRDRRTELCRLFRLKILHIAHPATGEVFKIQHARLMQLGMAAKQLLSKDEVLSAEEVCEKRSFLCHYFGITNDQLSRNVLVNTVKVCKEIDKTGHGVAVVSHLESTDDIIEFITDWRLCFATGLIPDHLDPHWIENSTRSLKDHFRKHRKKKNGKLKQLFFAGNKR